ncbi:MAG TPA: hypothetical protein VFZ65_10740 [Planctomycetota bacterium]|nr:hypothetical protein [Planctomycetota bacterium]
MTKQPLAVALLLTSAIAQEIPRSGSLGLDAYVVTTPAGTSSLYASSPLGAFLTFALPAPPSRWLHRRRHMAALETEIAFDRTNLCLAIPTGSQATNGGLSFFDFRSGLLVSHLPTTAPSAYDVLLLGAHHYALAAADDGLGNTAVDLYDYSLPGVAPVRFSLTVPGIPAAGVTRIVATANESHVLVATAAGVQILAVGALPTPLAPVAFLATAPRSPAGNIALFTRGTAPHCAVITSDFGPDNRPLDAAILSFDLTGAPVTTAVGNVPNTNPPKPYVPAAGFHDPGVVQVAGIAYVAFLLREKDPGTFFTKPAGVGVIGFGVPNEPTFAIPLTLPAAGEPFEEVAVFGTRIAFLTGGDPFWWPSPAGGSERLNILYTPLDPLGAGTIGGAIGSAGPLGGRIGTEVTDRPLWSRDGRHLFVTSSNFPGAPNPGIAGSEMLEVPAGRAIDEVQDHCQTLIPLGDQVSERAYGLPTRFDPIDLPAGAFGSFTLFGQYIQSAAHAILLPETSFGWIGSREFTTHFLLRDPNIPLFPVTPRIYDDRHTPTVVPPPSYGARRAAFNLLVHDASLPAVYMLQIADDKAIYHATGFNLMFGPQIPLLESSLPPGSRTSSEILSL